MLRGFLVSSCAVLFLFSGSARAEFRVFEFINVPELPGLDISGTITFQAEGALSPDQIVSMNQTITSNGITRHYDETSINGYVPDLVGVSELFWPLVVNQYPYSYSLRLGGLFYHQSAMEQSFEVPGQPYPDRDVFVSASGPGVSFDNVRADQLDFSGFVIPTRLVVNEPEPEVIPEPSSALLTFLGISGFGLIRRNFSSKFVSSHHWL